MIPLLLVVSCGDPDVNEGTTVTGGQLYNNNITYTCNDYMMPVSGDRTRQCQSDGTWSGQPLVCAPVTTTSNHQETTVLSTTKHVTSAEPTEKSTSSEELTGKSTSSEELTGKSTSNEELAEKSTFINIKKTTSIGLLTTEQPNRKAFSSSTEQTMSTKAEKATNTKPAATYKPTYPTVQTATQSSTFFTTGGPTADVTTESKSASTQNIDTPEAGQSKGKTITYCTLWHKINGEHRSI